MSSKTSNLFGFQGQITLSQKEELLGQQAVCIWLTGLSGSGKSSIGVILEALLHQAGRLATLLDGDNIRLGINSDLGFSESDRTENIRRIAEINKLMNSCGLITINCFVSPTESIRKLARDIVGDRFIEVFVDTPIETCEARDIKGLYSKARAGQIPDFTGVSSPFEYPERAEIRLETVGRTPTESAKELFELISPKIKRS